MEEARQVLNQILVHLFNDILKVEEKSLSKGAFKDLTMTDFHTIEAIGYNASQNMSTIAKKLSITVGTLTINMNHLVKKGYVQRIRSAKDRRVVLISLTNKGKDAYVHHQEFHHRMVERIMETMKDDELEALVRALKNLDIFFQNEKKIGE